MNKKLITILGIGAVLYILFLVRIPKIDPVASTYIVSCGNAQTQGVHGLEFVSGNDLSFTQEPGKKDLTPSFKNKDNDVITKFVCNRSGDLGPDSTPRDPVAYAKQVLASPDYTRVSLMAPNYGLYRSTTAYKPSWGEFVGRIVVLAILLVIGWVAGSLFIKP